MGTHPQLRLTPLQASIVRGVADEYELSEAGAIRRLAMFGCGWGEEAIGLVESEIQEYRLLHEAEAGPARVQAYRDAIVKSGRDSAAMGQWQAIRRVRLHWTHRAALESRTGVAGKLSARLKDAFQEGIGRWVTGDRPDPGMGTYSALAPHHPGSPAEEADVLTR